MAKITANERYKKKTYKHYDVRLRYDRDQELIDFVSENKDRLGMSQIFREALDMYVKANK